MSDYFPKHVRAKVLVLDCIRGLEDSLESTKELWADQPLCSGFVRRIRNNRTGCFRMLPVNEEGNLQLTPKQRNQYARYLELLRAIMKMFWVESVDAREFLAVCVELTEWLYRTYIDKQKVPNIQERVYWNDLIHTLDDLYGAYDPDLIAIDKLNRGEQIAGLFIKVIEGG